MDADSSTTLSVLARKASKSWWKTEEFYEIVTNPLVHAASYIVRSDDIDKAHRLTTFVKSVSDVRLKQVESIPTARSPFCKHSGSCGHNACRGFVKTFVAGFICKYIASLLPALATGKLFRKPSILLRNAGKDTMRFSMFLATWIAGFKGINCYLRRRRGKDDPLNAFIAGFISSFALLLDDKQRRMAIASYLASKSLQFTVMSLVRHKYLPRIPHADSIVMGLSSSQILYAFLLQPHSLSRPYHLFLLDHGGLLKHGPPAKAEQVMAGIAHSVYHPNEVQPPYPIPVPAEHKWPGCALEHPLTSSCTGGAGRFVTESFPRSMKLYLPIQLVMNGIFKRKQLKTDPARFIYRTLLSTARSSVFLTAYCTTAWLVPCLLRNALNREHPIYYHINGFLSGLCVLFETKSKRIELAMYCFPRAVESLWKCWVKWGWVKNIRNGEALYFSLAVACLMSVYQHDEESIDKHYLGVMQRFFGKN